MNKIRAEQSKAYTLEWLKVATRFGSDTTRYELVPFSVPHLHNQPSMHKFRKAETYGIRWNQPILYPKLQLCYTNPFTTTLRKTEV